MSVKSDIGQGGGSKSSSGVVQPKEKENFVIIDFKARGNNDKRQDGYKSGDRVIEISSGKKITDGNSKGLEKDSFFSLGGSGGIADENLVAGVVANTRAIEEQNRLLREQNELLRASNGINEKAVKHSEDISKNVKKVFVKLKDAIKANTKAVKQNSKNIFDNNVITLDAMDSLNNMSYLGSNMSQVWSPDVAWLHNPDVKMNKEEARSIGKINKNGNSLLSCSAPLPAQRSAGVSSDLDKGDKQIVGFWTQKVGQETPREIDFVSLAGKKGSSNRKSFLDDGLSFVDLISSVAAEPRGMYL